MKQQKSIFVTVGSTKFDELIQAIDNEEIQGQLKLLGYTKVICQIGNGSYVPTVEHFKFKPSLTDDYKNADLIICHGGAGTILECLRLRKKIIVINNDSLMDNHQMELFNALTTRQLVCGIKSTKLIKEQLLEQVQKLQFLKEYPVPEQNKINSIIDSMFVL